MEKVKKESIEKINLLKKWRAKLAEVESGETETTRPILSSMPFDKRIEYCKLMIDNIENEKNNRLKF